MKPATFASGDCVRAIIDQPHYGISRGQIYTVARYYAAGEFHVGAPECVDIEGLEQNPWIATSFEKIARGVIHTITIKGPFTAPDVAEEQCWKAMRRIATPNTCPKCGAPSSPESPCEYHG